MKTYLLLLPILSTTAFAASLNAPLTGMALTIESPCARHVEIVPDPTLHNQIKLQATADHPEEIDRLILESRDTARIRTRGDRCYRTALFENQPTLSLIIRVPAGFPLNIVERGASVYAIGPIAGSLSLDLSGAVDLSAAHAKNLHVDLSGAGNIKLGRVEGEAKLGLSGIGRVEIAQAYISSLSADISGTGMLTVNAGRIGKVELEDSGFGGARFAAETGDAQVDISGAGSVHFNKITGDLSKDASGMGSITVGQ